MGRENKLNLFGPAGLEGMALSLLDAFKDDIDYRMNGSQPSNRTGYKFNFTELDNGIVFKDDNLTVEAFKVNHGEFEDAYGFRFTSKDKVIVFSGDTGPSKSLEDYAKDADILVLGNLHPIVQSSVLDQMNSSSTFVILDTMNFWMDNTLDQLMEVIKRVEVITINDEEARQLTGEHSLVSAAKKIHDMGPDYVVIKKGEHGALLFNNENMFSAPALPLESVFDPTGAGDTFAGGFAGFLSKSQKINFESMKKAVVYGSALASFCVEKFGTERLKSLKSDEIGRRLTAFKKLTQFEIE